MEIYEITWQSKGIDRAGVNYLSPYDSFNVLQNGYVYRQNLQSRLGFTPFGNRLGDQPGDNTDNTRVMGIFEFVLPDASKDLLVITKKYLYSYNESTNIFEQIPNNSADPFTDFDITSNDDYVSGTGYPFADGSERFVFTGKGMDDIYFYDGTEVKRFTNTTDNPDYQAPASGALTGGTYISWFSERLNVFVPRIAGIPQKQQVLYSGIRNIAGNGDKFNVPGSGSTSAPTYEYMTGSTIAGDYVLLNFNRSSWTLEKTRDAFNPYFIRQIPSVLGTDAQFSATTWNNETESIGKTGILSSDGRTSLRVDDKIPYLTNDSIDQDEFNLTYGGFDRINGQFLFSYRQADSTLTPITQDQVLVRNYEESTWSINDMRFSVFGQTDKGNSLIWDEIVAANNTAWARMDETEEVWDRIGRTAATQKTLAGDDQSFVYNLNQDYDDYFVSITGITQASSAVITVDPCALQVGDLVTFANVEGMTEINTLTATVLSVSYTLGATTSITVNVDSTNFTPYTTGGSASKPIVFYAEMTPFNPYRSSGRKVYVSHIEFLINTNGGSLLLDMYDDEEESPFKANVPLIPDSSSTALRQYITATVDQESNFITFVMKQQSVSAQVIVTSIRIHAAEGGYTSA